MKGEGGSREGQLEDQGGEYLVPLFAGESLHSESVKVALCDLHCLGNLLLNKMK